MALALALALAWIGLAPPAVAQNADLPRALPEMPVTAENLSAREANNSPKLAVDPGDPDFVAAANRVDSPDFSCSLHVSRDGGRIWAPAEPVPQLPEGAEKCYAPEVAFDDRGTLYYLFLGLHTAGNTPMGAFLTTSSDGGQTFSPPRQVLGPDVLMVRMAIDPDADSGARLHLVWIEASGALAAGGFSRPSLPILASFSDDGGASFSEPVPVADPGRQRVVAPALALGPDGTVHILYYDLGDDVRDYQGLEGPVWEDPWSLVLATSRDSGASFAPGVVVEEGVVPSERVQLIFTMPPPALAADDSGSVYVGWTDARNGDADAYLRRSIDAGRTWAPAQRLNDDPQGSGRSQQQPRLSVAPGGRLDAIFYDRRDDPENILNHVSYTFSSDGGASFAPNLRLTTVPSDSRIGPRYVVGPAEAGLVEYGAGPALVSNRSEVMAAWTDTRNALGAGTEAAPRRTFQAVFSTVVEAPAVGGGSAWSPLTVAAVVVLSLAAVAVATMLARRNRSGEVGDDVIPGADVES